MSSISSSTGLAFCCVFMLFYQSAYGRVAQIQMLSNLFMIVSILIYCISYFLIPLLFI